MATETSKKFYIVTYMIPVQTGTIMFEAESAEKAVRAFQNASLNKLFRLAESATGDDPTIDSMVEYVEDPTDNPELDATAVEIDLTAVWRHSQNLDASIFTNA